MALFPTALGTTFGSANKFADSSALLDAASRMGAGALYLVGDGTGASLAADPSALVARRAELPIVALDAILGAARSGEAGAGRHGRRAARAQLASLERDEAEAAVAVARTALAFASELGAAHVVVGLGTARALGRLWRRLRGRFVRGVLHYDEASAQELMAARAALSAKHVDAAMRSLDRVVEEANRRQLSVLIRNPARPIDLPTSLELSAIRAELRGAPLAPFFDLPAAHLASMLHTCPLRETVLAFADGPLASLGDACGAIFGLIPGQGEVDIAAVARALPKEAGRAFIPAPGLTLEEVAQGYAAVSAL